MGNEILLNSSQSKCCSSLNHGNSPAHIRQRRCDKDNGECSKYMGNPANTTPSMAVPIVLAAQALLFLNVPEGAGQNWEKCSSLPLSMSTHTHTKSMSWVNEDRQRPSNIPSAQPWLAYLTIYKPSIWALHTEFSQIPKDFQPQIFKKTEFIFLCLKRN